MPKAICIKSFYYDDKNWVAVFPDKSIDIQIPKEPICVKKFRIYKFLSRKYKTYSTYTIYDELLGIYNSPASLTESVFFEHFIIIP